MDNRLSPAWRGFPATATEPTTAPAAAPIPKPMRVFCCVWEEARRQVNAEGLLREVQAAEEGLAVEIEVTLLLEPYTGWPGIPL